MEPASFAVGIVGLAGLFSSCLEAIDRAKDYMSFETDSQALNAQFEADRLRFERWGNSVGLGPGGQLSAEHHKLLDDERTAATAMGLLKFINEVCSPHGVSQQEAAGDRAMPWARKGFGPVSAQALQSTVGGSRRRKLTWAFGGKGERKSQVELFRRSVQQLHELVAPGSMDPSNKMMHAESQSSHEWLVQIQQFLAEKEAEIRREVHRWLVGDCRPNDVYDESLHRKLTGTCDWMLHQPSFTRWVSPDFPTDRAKLLWMSGQPGFGKTVLCAHLVDHLSSTLDAPVSHFFFSSDHESRNDPYEAMRHWVSQIVGADHRAFALVRQKWHTTQEPIAPRLTIIQLLREIMRDVPGCTLVVDGIDECTALSDSSRSVARFLEDAQELASSTTRILVVSRDEAEIRQTLQESSHCTFNEFKIRSEDVRADTAAYSQLIVDRRLKAMREEDKASLSEMMMERCGGQFLWLKMQEKTLKGWMNKRQLERTINTTPSGLDHLYERHWTRITRSELERDRAFSLLRWAAFAIRPLTVGEIIEAVLIDEDNDCVRFDDLPDVISDEFINDEILHLCSPLLELGDLLPKASSPSHRTVQLAHFTVKEFLVHRLPIRDIGTNGDLQTSLEQRQHTLLARLCLCYVRSHQTWCDATTNPTGNHPQANFRRYAASSWYAHADFGVPLEMDEGTLERILEFMDEAHPSWNSWRAWFDAQNEEEAEYAEDETTTPGPIYYAVRLGQTTVALRQINSRSCIEEQIEGRRSPLHRACFDGNMAIIEAMFESGASITARDIRGRTLVYSASWNGKVEVVKTLLQKGGQQQLDAVNDYGWTPINVAADGGHLEVVRLLVEKGADLTIAQTAGWTPIHSAVTGGYDDVVELLVRSGADITTADSDGWTLLHKAAKNGNIELAKLLMSNGADAAAKNDCGWPPLLIAAEMGHCEVIQMLIDKGVNTMVAQNDGWTPLHVAAGNGHLEAAKLLIDSGVDITAASNIGWTPINAAAAHGHPKVVKLLLDMGVDVEAIDKSGWTPLRAAAVNGQIEVVKFLISRGARITDANEEGWTPILMAASNGHLDVVRLLIDEGADANVANKQGKTPMRVAAEHGHQEVLRLLADRGVSITPAGDSE
ncbi:unnamed protein product [Clonostachys solani]|uniref:Uncharacterized protein n=1 Tax=Clonostachys solani TaxID=160281 RepID=A0A9N9Z1E4_9HYPO|nr:unnamed protein product [Clonostachys solani]